MDRKALDEMSGMDIRAIDKSALVDIRNIEVNPQQPIVERMMKYLRDVKNPYCFLVGDIPVQIGFPVNGKTLDESLKGCLKT